MARISISIPDRLISRLEPIKNGINLSQICREALEQRVAAFERSAERNGQALDLEGLVARLREERDLFGGKFEQLGGDNAAAWLATASYLEIRSAAENNSSSNMRKYKLPRSAFQAMKQDLEHAGLDCEGSHATVYKTAWSDYVRSVWAEVVDRLEPKNPPEPEPAHGY